jgi:Ni/Fe-hydrogenase subunit HybB-like protein
MASNHSTLEYSLGHFGPALPGQFDFTLLFEYTILSIVPSVLLLSVLPFRIFSLRKESRKVSRSHLHENKLVRWLVVISFDVADTMNSSFSWSLHVYRQQF